MLMPIYAAGEKPIKGVSAKKLISAVKRGNKKLKIDYVESDSELINRYKIIKSERDMILFLGAGDICESARVTAKALKIME